MVGKVRRKVQAACDLTHDFSRLQADLLQGNQQSMLKEKTRLLNPPPITDYPQVLEDDPMLKKGRSSSPPPPFLVACHLSLPLVGVTSHSQLELNLSSG